MPSKATSGSDYVFARRVEAGRMSGPALLARSFDCRAQSCSPKRPAYPVSRNVIVLDARSHMFERTEAKAVLQRDRIVGVVFAKNNQACTRLGYGRGYSARPRTRDLRLLNGDTRGCSRQHAPPRASAVEEPLLNPFARPSSLAVSFCWQETIWRPVAADRREFFRTRRPWGCGPVSAGYRVLAIRTRWLPS